jgi:tetrahydromethanopterin S-methyltransferase subunit D
MKIIISAVVLGVIGASLEGDGPWLLWFGLYAVGVMGLAGVAIVAGRVLGLRG